MEVPKKEAVPKSDNVSIATRLKPINIAGRADGSMTLKNLWVCENPKLLDTSIRFCDWFTKDDRAKI